ncbi:MAG: hypothetical protein OJI67_13980 [Prosthecobacter sp.]|nr:hypothetical protein [Prosthecobacter sp.]
MKKLTLQQPKAQNLHLFLAFISAIGFPHLDASDLYSRQKLNGVIYMIAESAPINEQAWRNLEAKSLLEAALADIFATLVQQPFDLPPAILQSLESLENSGVKLSPWGRGRVSARITLAMASNLIGAEMDQAKIATVLERASPVINQFALQPMAPIPQPGQLNWDPDIKRQEDEDVIAYHESDNLELDLVCLRGTLYQLLKPASNPGAILDSAKIPTAVRELLEKDLSSANSNELGDLLWEGWRQRLIQRPVKTDYISNNPGFQPRSKMHP